MKVDEKISNIEKATHELKLLGYDTFSKRILHHSDFASTNCKFTHWKSPAIVHHHKDVSKDIDYKRFEPTKNILDEKLIVENISVADFLKLLNTDIVDIKVNFTADVQVLVTYTESLSARSIYAWDNNWYISHITDQYLRSDDAAWKCNIEKYSLNTLMWYPANIITHAPWYNMTNDKTEIINLDYICIGFDQTVDASNIGKRILPHLDDVSNVASCPEVLLKDDIRQYADLYNEQMLNETYKFDPNNKSGWLFVVIDGFMYSRKIIVATVDKRNKRRYFSFI